MKALFKTDFGAKVVPFMIIFSITLLIAPFIGSVSINPLDAISNIFNYSNNTDAAILFGTRIPGIIIAALSGAALAASGAVFQSLLENPLATPYTTGISSGGALGAVLAIKFGIDCCLKDFSVPLFAFGGALLTVFLVYSLAKTRRGLPTVMLLLAGVAVSFFFSAMVLFIEYLADFSETHMMIHWLMGSFDISGYSDILLILPFFFIGTAIQLLFAGSLDQLAMGELAAHSRGVNVFFTRTVLYMATSLSVGAVVSIAGPIGFVGLIIPHSIRFLTGPSNRYLIPASIFAGASFMIVCDIVAKIIIAPTRIPVGVITAMIGGPFFMILLFREKRKFS